MCESNHKNISETPAWEDRMLELTVVLSIYGIVGFVGNMLILIVYCKRKSRLSHSPYICTLAAVDLTVCCVIIPYTIAYERHLVSYDTLCRGLEILRHTLVISSSEILCAIAVERYFSVFKPMRKQSRRRVRTVMIFVFINSIIVALPSVTIFTVTTHPEETVHCPNDNSTDTTETMSVILHEYCQFTFEVVSRVWALSYQLLLAVEFFLSVGIIVVLYTRVYLEIWRRAKWRGKISAVGSKVADSVKSKEEESNPEQKDEAPGVFSTNCTQLSPPSGNHSKPIDTANNRKQLQVISLGRPLQNGVTNTHRVNQNRKLAPFYEMSMLQVPARHLNGTESAELEGDNIQNGSAKGSKRVHFVGGGSSEDNNDDGDDTIQTLNATLNGTTLKQRALSRQNNQRKAGTMLFICTLIYIVTWLPFWIDVFGLTDNLVFRYSFLLGHATNPLVYGIVNTKVRQEVKRVLQCQ